MSQRIHSDGMPLPRRVTRACDLLEIAQIGAAAAFSAAHSESAAQLDVVALVKLAEFDAGVQSGGELLHELTEIHPFLRREIQHDALAVERNFRRNKFQRNPELLRLLLGDFQRARLGLFGLPVLIEISAVRFAKHLFEFLLHGVFRDLVISFRDLSELVPLLGLHHDEIPLGIDLLRGIEGINLLIFIEFYANDDRHLYFTSTSFNNR